MTPFHASAARRADDIVAEYGQQWEETDTDRTHVVMLLCDLMHWAVREGVDWARLLTEADECRQEDL